MHNKRLNPSVKRWGVISTATTFLRRFERVIRYVIVGGGVTLFYTFLTVGLLSGHVVDDPTFASAIASLVTLPISFLVHRAITYADVASERAQWTRFAIIAVSNFALNIGLMKAIDLLHWPYWIALIIGWVLIPLVNYTINALWVFRAKTFWGLHRKSAPEPSDTDVASH